MLTGILIGAIGMLLLSKYNVKVHDWVVTFIG